jgi:glycosyltransferase involved in cell wall biosynthesis
MKVLQISAILNIAAIGRITEEIGQLLMAKGHESYVGYSMIGVNRSQSKTIKIGNRADLYLHGIKTRIFDRHGFGSESVTKSFIKQIKEIDPDVIGLHNIHGYYLNVRLLFEYLKEAGKPVIWTFHDCWPFTGHCSYFDFVNCDRWKTQCFSCPNKHAYPASWVMDQSRDNYFKKKELFNGVKNLTIVTPSDWLAGFVKQSFLSDYPVRVINNGVNTAVFLPRSDSVIRNKYEIGNKKLILGIAYIWSPRKGLNDFIALGNQLGSEYKVFLVGLSLKQLKQLPENIIGISRTESVDELAELYSTADVFVNPTWQDNFPTTNLEALACGTPVVTYNTGGSPEAIDEKTGIVVEKGDINGLQKAIEQIIAQGKNHYSLNCRERAIALFKKEDRNADYLELYKKMLSQSNQSAQ